MWRPSGLSSPRRDRWPPAFTSTVRRFGEWGCRSETIWPPPKDQGDVDLRTRLDGDRALQHYRNASRGSSKAQVPEMLQALLADRFEVKLHNEKKEYPIFALVLGKGPPKLKELPPDPTPIRAKTS